MLVLKKNIFSIDKHTNLVDKLSLHHNYYQKNQQWSRLLNTLSLSFPFLQTKSTLAYTHLLKNNGSSTFLFDTINKITDNEINYQSIIPIHPLIISVNVDYKIKKDAFRNFKYSLGFIIHCWQLDVSVDTIWNEFSFGISIPNL